MKYYFYCLGIFSILTSVKQLFSDEILATRMLCTDTNFWKKKLETQPKCSLKYFCKCFVFNITIFILFKLYRFIRLNIVISNQNFFLSFLGLVLSGNLIAGVFLNTYMYSYVFFLLERQCVVFMCMIFNQFLNKLFYF